MIPTTYLEINRLNFRYNLNEYRKLLGETTKVIAVIKADGYGCGAIELANVAIQENITMLAVAKIKEGIELRNAGISDPILVLGATIPQEMPTAIENNLIVVIYSIEQLEELNLAAIREGKETGFHLMIETGMNRLGIQSGHELEEFLDVLDESEGVRFSGVCSHFATADDIDPTYTKQQYQIFTEAMRQVRRRNYAPKTHISNSAATSSYDFCRLDYVRLGIGLYGLMPDEKSNIDLEPVASLHSCIAQVKNVNMGESISYGRTYFAKKDMKIATIPIGYADGYPRALSNKGQVIINSTRCDIVGRICMDHTIVDVSHLKDVNLGDDVVLIGTQGDETIKASEVAKWADTIHYEIITGIQKRVERIYID